MITASMYMGQWMDYKTIT